MQAAPRRTPGPEHAHARPSGAPPTALPRSPDGAGPAGGTAERPAPRQGIARGAPRPAPLRASSAPAPACAPLRRDRPATAPAPALRWKLRRFSLTLLSVLVLGRGANNFFFLHFFFRLTFLLLPGFFLVWGAVFSNLFAFRPSSFSPPSLSPFSSTFRSTRKLSPGKK